MTSEKLMLIDGNSIINRAYFALPPLNDNEGRNVNAVYGFVNILLKVIADYSPTKLAVTFDKRGKNFRKDIYPEYKANRKGMPDDLAAQMPVLHRLLETMGVAVVEKEGVEADDIIGTLAGRFGDECIVVSGDRDMLQLIDDKVTVLLTKRGVTEVERVDTAFLAANYSLTPRQVIEYKALRGDTSDNIPGVRGIGEKTATALIARYGDIDTLYGSLDDIKGALRDKLAEGKDMAYISRTLATIVRNADVECDFARCNLPVFNEGVRSMFEKLQFRSLLSRLQFDVTEKCSSETVVTVEITDAETLAEAVKEMENSEYFAFVPDKDVWFSCDAHKQYFIRVSDNFLEGLREEEIYRIAGPLLSGSKPKAVYDWKSVRHKLRAAGVELNNVRYDVALMQYLVEYRAYKDLPSLASAYGYTDLCAAVYTLAGILDGQLRQTETSRLYYETELPLADLLYRMEIEGVLVDTETLDSMSADFHKQIDALSEEIYLLAGERFNIASPKQLSVILFDKLGLKHFKKNNTGFSTNNDVLDKLLGEHPIVEKIVEYRKISKLLGTYLDGLKPLIRRGLVHTTYNQWLTSTGRLSSSDPNLQNIPIRNDMGKEIRKLFVSKYGVFVGADYSQIELRLLAAFSQDENLLGAFNNGEDIHRKVAAELLGIPPEMVNPDMRRMAKAVNFGIIYGISDFGLSRNTGISVKKAREYISLYFGRFPKIKTYLDSLVKQAKDSGYVTTITGRRRQIPEIKSANYNLRNFGERAAMNMPLQGSAADIMKIAMLKADRAIAQAGLKSKIVMQVHDELIADCFVEEAEQVKSILKREMENAVSLACPLVAETEEGRSLYEA